LTTNDQGDLVDAGVRKDRNRDGFFKRNTNELPPGVIELFNKANASDKRRLVNEVVIRDDSGSWTINVQAPILREWQEKFCEVRRDKGLITKPRGLAAQQWGGWTSLNDAQRRGEVWVVTHNDKEYYQWREFTETEREGHRGGVSTEGSRRLEKKDYLAINEHLSQYQWNIELTKKEEKEWQGEHPKVPEKVIENLGKVQKACDRAHKEAKDLYRMLSDRGDMDNTAKAIAADLRNDFEATPT